MGRIQFLMDTNGHCFLCLKSPSSLNSSTSFETGENGRKSDPKICSFRNICEYLKINLWEVSNEAMPLHSGSLPVLERSELKGVLCEGCFPLLDRFSKDFVELEGIRMKLQHSLKLIHGTMVAAEKSEGKATERSEREVLLRKQAALKNSFMEQLRRKTLERCSVVIETGHPLLMPKQTQILAEEPMSATQFVVEGQPGETQMLVIPSTSVPTTSIETKVDNVAQPFDSSIANNDDDDIMVIHEETQVGDPGARLKCNLCYKDFAQAIDLQNHRMDTHMDKQFKCEYCPKTFSMSIVRNKHMQRRCPMRFAQATSRDGGDPIPINSDVGSTDLPPAKRGRGRPKNSKNLKGGRKDAPTQELERDMSSNIRFPKRKPKGDGGSKGDLYAFEFECDCCHKSFALKFQRDRHQRMCSQHLEKSDIPQSSIDTITEDKGKLNKENIMEEGDVTSPPLNAHGDDDQQQTSMGTVDETSVEPDRSPEPKPINQINEVYPKLCRFCNKKFHSKKMMKRHLASVHKATVECEVCHAAFKSKQGLRTHRQTIHLQQKAQCDFCSKIFSQVSNRNHHMRSACPNRGKGKVNLSTEKPIEKKQDIVPNEPEKIDVAPPGIDGPFDENEDEPFFTEVECDVCQEKVSDPPSHKCTQLETTLKFNEQGEVVGEEVIPKLPLLTIPEPLSTSPKNMKMSIDKETGHTKCGICSKVFPRKSVFLNHYMSSHLNTTYLCNLCGKEYYHRSDYTRHHRESHSGIRFKCDCCEKLFSQKEKLLEHRLSAHSPPVNKPDDEDDQPHEPTAIKDEENDKVENKKSSASSDIAKIRCTECPREFIYEMNYQEHLKNVHSPDLQFDCNQCGKKFTGHLNLLRHKENVHRGSRFRCDICDKLFTQKCNLQAHKRAYHFGKMFPCSGCSKEFPSEAKMKMHVRVKNCGKRRQNSKK